MQYTGCEQSSEAPLNAGLQLLEERDSVVKEDSSVGLELREDSASIRDGGLLGVQHILAEGLLIFLKLNLVARHVAWGEAAVAGKLLLVEENAPTIFFCDSARGTHIQKRGGMKFGAVVMNALTIGVNHLPHLDKDGIGEQQARLERFDEVGHDLLSLNLRHMRRLFAILPLWRLWRTTVNRRKKMLGVLLLCVGNYLEDGVLVHLLA